MPVTAQDVHARFTGAVLIAPQDAASTYGPGQKPFTQAASIVRNLALRLHRTAARPPSVPRVSAAGLRNLNDTITLYKAEGRLPSAKSPSERERALAVWLLCRRQDNGCGIPSPTYQQSLQEIPGREQRTRKGDNEKRWNQRLLELGEYMTAGNDWPRHKKTASEEERVLGMWLHIQRMKYRSRELDQDKESQLNAMLPAWRIGRVRGPPPLAQSSSGRQSSLQSTVLPIPKLPNGERLSQVK